MELSRRSFLKGAALTGASATLAGATAGCSPSGKTKGTASAGSAGEALTAETARNQKWAFEIAPDPIPESDITETISADIIVVGGGMSGMCTACRATELGADVIVVSASSKPVSRGGSNNGIGSAYQKSLGIESTPQNVAHQMKVEQLIAGYDINTELWGKWIRNSGESIDWMCGIMNAKGLKTALEAGKTDPDGFFTSLPSSHTFWNEESPMGAMNGAPAQAAAYAECIIENGGKIYYNTFAEQLERENDNTGRVTSVIAKKEDGSYARFAANKAVVLATGDFSKDRDMMTKYAPAATELLEDVILWDTIDYDAGFNFTGLYPGTGHKMALWIGAAWQKSFPNPVMVNTLPGVVDLAAPILNVRGERFINENIGGCFGSFWAKILPHLEKKTAYFIWDTSYAYTKEAWDDFGTVVDYVNGIPATTPEGKIEGWETYVQAGAIKKADTIEGLLSQLDIDAKTAAETIANWNAYCEKGEDNDFQLNPAFLHSVKTAPFYAIPITPQGVSFLTVMGGLRTNGNLQVCDEDDEPIEGLYCVGTMIGDFFSDLYTFDVFGQNLGACCCTLPYLLAGDLAPL